MSSLEMPAAYFGAYKKGNKYVKTTPREWTTEEVQWITTKIEEGHKVEEIAAAIERSVVSVRLKMKRQTKTNDSYNEKNRAVKYAANETFFSLIKPNSVLDVFAGHSWYKDRGLETLVTNDKDPRFDTTWHADALLCLAGEFVDGQRYDIVDLDPYGSAYDCFDLAIKTAKKGLIVSFGEWGHKRWKRYDFVRPRYGISGDDTFTSEAFIEEVQRLGAINKKKLNVTDSVKYNNFLRVYFSIEKLTITEQWREEE